MVVWCPKRGFGPVMTTGGSIQAQTPHRLVRSDIGMFIRVFQSFSLREAPGRVGCFGSSVWVDAVTATVSTWFVHCFRALGGPE